MEQYAKARPLTRWDRGTSYAFIVPALASIMLFMVYPFFYTLLLSFSKINLASMKLDITGFSNYIQLFKDEAFVKSLGRTVVFAFTTTVLSTLLGVLFALLLNQKFVGRAFGRSILILPWAVPWIVIGIMWHWMFNAQFGSLNGLLFQLGIIKDYYPFLGNPRTALFITALPCAWRQSAFSTILLLASIQTIPGSLYESATIDGANIFQRLNYITLPWIMPTLIIVIMFNALYGLMQFATVFIMTQGGPASATEIIAIYLYRKAFEDLKMGPGAAVGYIISIMCILVGLLCIRLLRRVEQKF